MAHPDGARRFAVLAVAGVVLLAAELALDVLIPGLLQPSAFDFKEIPLCVINTP